ncbi:carbonic anhydrase [Geminocystis sp. NIES-3708]|uniref:carbonic anhydrase n=1 Tax=Geminocystis sp. NIES-3708 TaxID=1615909 RepID=UPI0005FCAFE4|nr:carbonic anhydrase [Geminocystis sp. NIES-3708]BAQ59976.1 carbonic anhydrase [Geminocystis sp. NIES-3708]
MTKIDLSRRNLLQLGALSLVSGSFVTAMSKANSKEIVALNEVTSNLNPEEALQSLLAGNERFINNKSININRSLTRIQEVAKGQNPFAILLSCADSRVPVEILFDRGFGDLFVVRNAGNIATPEEVGSIEFGSLVLGAKVILVLGHGSCGAVKATIEGNVVPGQIQSVLDAIKPALNNLTPEEKKDLPTAIKANVKLQVETLKKSNVIAQLIAENKLKIVGGYYDLTTGKVSLIS